MGNEVNSNRRGERAKPCTGQQAALLGAAGRHTTLPPPPRPCPPPKRGLNSRAWRIDSTGLDTKIRTLDLS